MLKLTEDYARGLWANRDHVFLIKYCWWMVSMRHSRLMSIGSTCLSWFRHVFVSQQHLENGKIVNICACIGINVVVPLSACGADELATMGSSEQLLAVFTDSRSIFNNLWQTKFNNSKLGLSVAKKLAASVNGKMKTDEFYPPYPWVNRLTKNAFADFSAKGENFWFWLNQCISGIVEQNCKVEW